MVIDSSAVTDQEHARVIHPEITPEAVALTRVRFPEPLNLLMDNGFMFSNGVVILMAVFEFGWIGLLLVMISGGFGAVGLLPFLGVGPDADGQGSQLTAFLLFFVVLSSLAAILASVV